MTARTLRLLPFLLAVNASLVAAPPPALVDESATEFQTLADVNGDGNPDLVVVDKASGQVRIAETDNNGNIAWRERPFDSGLRNVEGFTAGYLLDNSRESLALCSTLDNRIQLIDTPAETILVEPQMQMPQREGPACLTALQVPGGPAGGFTEDFEDLVYHSVLHDPVDTNIVRGLRNSDGSLPLEEFTFVDSGGTPRRPEAVTLEAGTQPVYAFLRTALSGLNLELYDTEDPIALIDSLSGLPEAADFVAADFDGDNDAEFVFWVPGSPTLYEAEWSGGLSVLTNFNYGSPVDGLRVIYSAGGPELLVLRDGGTEADRVSYGGGGSYSVEETFTSARQPFTGAVSTEKVLHLLTGTSASSGSLSYRFDGANHNFETSGTLPELRLQDTGSSVLIFDDNPLTRSEARLLSRLDAGAWTSAFDIGGATASVDSERFVDTDQGLGDLQVVNVNSLPVGASAGLTRQVFDDLSMRFEESPIGAVTARLSLLPASGSYTRAVQPELSLNGSGLIYYRTSDSSWTFYDVNNPPVLITDTVFYGIAFDGSTFSNIVKATYTFPEDPGEQDSNGDGVPDFVAEEFGLNPLNSKWDSDGDGYSDREEILAGTKPFDSSDFSFRADVAFEFPNQFDLEVAPAIPDPSSAGSLRTLPTAPNQTKVQANQPSGSLVGSALTTGILDPYPSATLENITSADEDLFMILSTDLNFEVDLGVSLTASYGRQLAVLYPMPDLEYTPFSYTDFGSAGGFADLTAETAAWLSAAQAHYSGLSRPTYTKDPLDYRDTLTLLLVEQFLGAALEARGLIDRSNISLTPFRSSESPLSPEEADTGDGSRDRSISNALLLSLQLEPDGPGQSYELHQVIASIDGAVQLPKTAEQSALLELARLLYTLHATDSEAGSLRQPLDALRRFLRTGSLSGTGFDKLAYVGDLPLSLQAAAAAGAAQILALPEARTPTTVYVYYDGAPLDANCPVWEAVFYSSGSFDPENPLYTGQTWSFVDDSGAALPIGRAFPLTSGSVFAVRGYELESALCGDRTLEVIPQPALAYLNNASTIDADGNLVPDAIEALAPGVSFNPFGDSDDDGYSDLQELIDGSDPHASGSIPMIDDLPASQANLSPPALTITAGITDASIRFDYPSGYADDVVFDLYKSSDLEGFTPSGISADHLGGGVFELSVPIDSDKKFYRLRLRLK